MTLFFHLGRYPDNGPALTMLSSTASREILRACMGDAGLWAMEAAFREDDERRKIELLARPDDSGD